MARIQNVKMTNVEAVWTKFCNSYKQSEHSYKGEPWVGTMAESHIQGFSILKGDGKKIGIASHNNKGYEEGFMMYLDAVDDFDDAIKQYVPIKHYNHPGGLQLVGDYMFLAVEDSKYEKSYIRLCDLTNLYQGKDPVWIPESEFVIHTEEHGAGAVGATRYVAEIVDNVAIEKMLIVSHDNGNLYIYECSTSENFPIDKSQKPAYLGKQKLYEIQGVVLITQQGGPNEPDDVYLWILNSKRSGSSYKDLIELWKYNKSTQRFEKCKEEFHVKTSGGGSHGNHFRYGAGATWGKDSIELYATRKNFIGNLMMYDILSVK